MKSEADWAAFFDDVWGAEGAKNGIWGTTEVGVYEESMTAPRPAPDERGGVARARGARGPAGSTRRRIARQRAPRPRRARRAVRRDAADPDAAVLPGGHGPDEAPDEVAAAVHGFLSYHHADEEDVVITASWWRTCGRDAQAARKRLAGTSSKRTPAPSRAWIVLNGVSIGEAAPCRGVHAESAADARAALRRCAAKLEHVTIPAAVRQIDGSLNRFLHDVCGADAELPSVRFALETAVVGLITRSPSALYASALGRGARGSVDIAALVDGEDDAPSFLPNRVVKLKAGVLEPERDAARVRDAVRTLQGPRRCQ